MKQLLLILVIAFLLAGCGPSNPSQIVDNGKPGQIRVLVFWDKNFNGKMEGDETGLADQVILGQDMSCPATNPSNYTRNDTAADGSIVFSDLKPGHYCVAYGGNRTSSTKLTIEVDLSSEQTIDLQFGVSGD